MEREPPGRGQYVLAAGEQDQRFPANGQFWTAIPVVEMPFALAGRGVLPAELGTPAERTVVSNVY